MNYTSFRGPSGRHSAYGHGSSTKSRSGSTSLHLPGLPRYHPMNYASPHSSADASPLSGASSPTAPMSPRQRQQHYSESQRQLHQQPKDLLSHTHARNSGLQLPHSSTLGGSRPNSPRLNPLGSPGPVTPLELERAEGYLLGGAAVAGLSEDSKEQIVEHLIQKESRASSRRMADPSGSDEFGSRPQSRAGHPSAMSR